MSKDVIHTGQCVSTSGEAVTVAQEVVKTILAKGYVLGKDALIEAKAFDEYHGVSATAAAKIAELSDRIGLTDKFHVGMETVKSVDEKFHVPEITKSAATVTGTAAVVAAMVTGKAAVASGHAVVNSTYLPKEHFGFQAH
ncbi:binding partner of ACD11 1-like [Quercus suber]|uniref:binding partner of ACD11 1-like n=1 Tax=Quercus suber TaxID=58331 RepID=UPI000D29A42F|nr:binding partner of acd11 1 [Quercus suber]